MATENISINLSFGFIDYYLIGIYYTYRNPKYLAIFVIMPLLSIISYLFFKIAGDLAIPPGEIFITLCIIMLFELVPIIKSFSDAITLWARNRKSTISSFEVSEHFLLVKSTGIENKIEWSIVKNITENRRYYFVKIETIQFVLPKSEISNNSELRSIFRKCLNKKAKLKIKYDEVKC